MKNYMIAASRRAYVRPLIDAVVPVSLLLLSASTDSPKAPIEGGPGDEALSKESQEPFFDLWEQEEDYSNETMGFD